MRRVTRKRLLVMFIDLRPNSKPQPKRSHAATIGPGSSGDDVKRLQRVLARMLLWNPFGPITGVFDASLEASVKSFQQANGLTPDGVVGAATWAKLPAYREASATLRNGSTGPAVAWLQQALSGADVAMQFQHYTGAIDGIFGPLTEGTTRALQMWANLASSQLFGHPRSAGKGGR